MNDTIKIKGGGGNSPKLQDRELGYNKTKKELYIGTPNGNVRLCGADDLNRVATKEYVDEKYNDLYSKLLEYDSRLTHIESHIHNKYYRTEKETAYERIIPEIACPVIELNSIGGSYARASNNLFDPNLFYNPIINEQGEVFCAGGSSKNTSVFTLPEGTYTISSNFHQLVLYGEGISGDTSSPNYIHTFMVDAENFITLVLAGDVSDDAQDGYSGIMLVSGETEKPYESFYKHKPAIVTSIELYNANHEFLKTVLTIPHSIQGIEGYGYGMADYSNVVDFENKKFIKTVEKIAFTGNEDGWSGLSFTPMNNNYFFLPIGALNTAIKGQIVSEAYPTVTISSSNSEKGIYLANSASGEDRILIRPMDADTISLPEFKARLAERYNSGDPITAVYALTTPVENDIASELQSFDNAMDVQAGGTLRFVNDAKAAIPSTISYLAKEGSV